MSTLLRALGPNGGSGSFAVDPLDLIDGHDVPRVFFLERTDHCGICGFRKMQHGITRVAVL